jgi:hypothetical protein
MTVETGQSRVDYAGNGQNGPFAIPFPFQDNLYIKATRLSSSGQPTDLDLGYDYNLSGAGDSAGGELTLTQPLAYGDLLVIVRETPLTQSTRYREQGPFSARATESAFDKAACIDIDRARKDSRNLRVSYLNREVQNTEIQGVGANKVLKFTADGRGVEAAYIRDLLLDATGGAINVPITQINHNLAVGTVMAMVGNTLQPGLANNEVTAEVVGLVSKVINRDRYILTTTGQISGLSGLNAGSVYFLSDKVAGQLSLTSPATPQTVSKPVLVAQSATSGFIVNYRGKINPDSTVGGGHNVTNSVVQANHGFTVGQVLFFNNADQSYELACANAFATTSTIGIVASVDSVNTFTLLQNGYINGLNLPASGLLYLSDVIPGAMTGTQPVTTGNYSVCLMEAVDKTQGYFFNFQPIKIAPVTTTPNPTPANTNQVAQPNSTIISYTNVNGVNQFTLPTTTQVGDSFRVLGYNGLGWSLVQNSGQTVSLLGTYTTRGQAGSVTSTTNQDCIEVVCVIANTDFIIATVVGNINFV